MKIKDIYAKKLYNTKIGLWYVDYFANGHVFLIGKNRKFSLPLVYFAPDVINECSKIKTFLFCYFHINKVSNDKKIAKFKNPINNDIKNKKLHN